MPLFDPLLRRLVVRIVYDGPALAGKTTNVQQICRVFPVRKRTEVYTPASLKGRTMFFDWLEVDLNTLGRFPVRVQILSVTGQESRSYRRRPLIQSADTVVFVCDSCSESLDCTRQRLLLLRRYLRERKPPAPYLIQANKQDLPDALSPRALMDALRWREDVLVLPAAATAGQGVNETFHQAARAAARHAQAIVAERGLAGIAGTPETADVVLDSLLMLEDQVDLSGGESGLCQPLELEASEELQAVGS
jgi:signal recognition particle receptor subunit beta